MNEVKQLPSRRKSSYRIAWLPGDGIGTEVCDAARKALNAVSFPAEYLHGDIGWEFWKKEGEALPERTLNMMKKTDCALFGAITSKPKNEAELELRPELKGKGFVYTSPIVRMRQLLDLYICLRPCKAYIGNPLNYRYGMDIAVFRENTEGMYIGVEYDKTPKIFYTAKGMEKISGNAAISLRAITPEGSDRIARAAFKYARDNNRKKVTAVHKANVLRATDAVFLEAVRDVAKEFPEITFDEANVDAMCMWLLKNPLAHDVIVTTNLFGDILSDLCAQMVGGLGFACSGNIGDNYAVFEPTHGSAPKYAGKNKANPLATILSAKMMLEWLGETERAAMIENAVARIIKEGKVCTYDMGGTATTTDMAEAVVEAIL